MPDVRSPSIMFGRPFTISEAAASGLTVGAVRRMLHKGVIRHVLDDAYIDTGTEVTLDVRIAALAKVAPPNAVCCDETAAWAVGVDLLPIPDPLWVPPLEVFRAAGGDRVRRAGCGGGKRGLDLVRDVVDRAGVSITSDLRTACDLGRLRRRTNAYAAMNALAAHGGFGVAELTAELPRFRGMRGIVQLRTLVPMVEPRVESPAESVVLLQVIDGGLPTPRTQFVITNMMGIEMYRLDFAYPQIKLAVEYDGVKWHSSDEQRRGDERRRSYLQRKHGWTFVVLRKEHVFVPDPLTVAMIRAGISEATARLAS